MNKERYGAKEASVKARREEVWIYAVLLAFLIVSSYGVRAFGANLVLPAGGRVTIEFISSDSDATNILSVISPTAPFFNSAQGCRIVVVPAVGLPGAYIFSGGNTPPGCKVALDP